jgi:outer membrane receptor protein involved in Fe transport
VLPGAAKWNIASSITYRWRDLPFEPTFRLSQRYISTAPAQLGPGTVQDGYDIVDASVAFDVSDNILVSAFVKNIGDARGVTQAYAGPPYLNQYLIPRRIYGVTFDYKM